MLEFNEFGSPGNAVANGAGGQIDRAHNGPNLVDAIGEHSPGGIAIDAASQPPRRHLYVADTVNNRVLGWRDVAAFAAAQPADIVIGQPDLFSYKCNNGVAAGDVGGTRRGQPVRTGADGGRCDREICTSRTRATTACWCTTRRSTRPAASRARATRRRISFTGKRARSRRGAAIRAAPMRRPCAIRRRRRSTAPVTSI